MFDIFYINKPIKQQGRRVYDVDEAIKLCRTRYAWIVDGHNDYTHFDFAWEPVPGSPNKHMSGLHNIKNMAVLC